MKQADYSRFAEPKDDGKRWFKVDITETYHETCLVRAIDEFEAQEIADDLVGDDIIDPTATGEYERSTEPVLVDVASLDDGETYWERGEDDW